MASPHRNDSLHLHRHLFKELFLVVWSDAVPGFCGNFFQFQHQGYMFYFKLLLFMNGLRRKRVVFTDR